MPLVSQHSPARPPEPTPPAVAADPAPGAPDSGALHRARPRQSARSVQLVLRTAITPARYCVRLVALPVWQGQLQYAVPASLAGSGPGGLSTLAVLYAAT